MQILGQSLLLGLLSATVVDGQTATELFQQALALENEGCTLRFPSGQVNPSGHRRMQLGLGGLTSETCDIASLQARDRDIRRKYAQGFMAAERQYYAEKSVPRREVERNDASTEDAAEPQSARGINARDTDDEFDVDHYHQLEQCWQASTIKRRPQKAW